MSLSRGYLHIRDHYFQTSSSMKLFGQSKPNFIWSPLGKRKKVYINGPGHIIKMAAVSIYIKTVKIISSRTNIL